MSYLELIKHAFLPTVISYVALISIVHLEALKLGLKGLPRTSVAGSLLQKLTGFLFGYFAMSGFAFAVYYGLSWIKFVFPELTGVAKILLFGAIYIGQLAIAARHPYLTQDEPDAQVKTLPRPREVTVTSPYFMLLIFVLVWNFLVDRLLPSYSTYWATPAMISIVFTQHSLKALLCRCTKPTADLLQKMAYRLTLGAPNFIEGMIGGARNMIGIAVATGAAGVIIGTVALTGAHQVIGEFVEYLSGGNLMSMLALVALISLILGMGLPKTANYIVVSSMMAPVIVSVGA